MTPGASEEHLVDRPPGGVCGVCDPPDGVTAFPGQVQAERSIWVRRERHALFDEPFDRRTAVLADKARRALVNEASAGLLGVANVQVHAVVVAQHAHDPALGPGCGSLVEATLGEQDDWVAVGEVEGDRQASETGSDDDDGARSRVGRSRFRGGGDKWGHVRIVRCCGTARCGCAACPTSKGRSELRDHVIARLPPVWRP
jgi:hypothetical protein